ncbi:MAG: glutathione S-transferase family protein [Maricaulaceae bacterium]|jgi:glutathione S-transferase
MADLILHHYWTSPYAGKIHAILGYKNMTWRSCEAPVIPPRPNLDPFLAPFRRIPVLQIGADFFCDSRLIARVLDAIAPEPTLFPPGSEGLSRLVAGWAEPRVFTNIGPLRFRSAKDIPAVADGRFTAEEFFADRIPFIGRAASHSPKALAASREDHLRGYLDAIETVLEESGDFVCGAAPSAADFSFAHTVWFLSRPPAREDLLAPFPRVRAWAERLQSFGHGSFEPISGEDAHEAVRAGQDATPFEPPWPAFDDERLGREVEVAPDDYGKNPMRGKLIASTRDHVAIEREAAGFGTVRVHVPRIGHEIVDAALVDQEAARKRAE